MIGTMAEKETGGGVLVLKEATGSSVFGKA